METKLVSNSWPVAPCQNTQSRFVLNVEIVEPLETETILCTGRDPSSTGRPSDKEKFRTQVRLKMECVSSLAVYYTSCWHPLMDGNKNQSCVLSFPWQILFITPRTEEQKVVVMLQHSRRTTGQLSNELLLPADASMDMLIVNLQNFVFVFTIILTISISLFQTKVTEKSLHSA